MCRATPVATYYTSELSPKKDKRECISSAIFDIDVPWLAAEAIFSWARDICLIWKWPGSLFKGSTQWTTTPRTLVFVSLLPSPW